MALHSYREVQQRLNDLGFDAGPADGDFGTRSRKALTKFQTAAGLDPDGRYGPASEAALFADGAPRARAPVDRDDSYVAPIGHNSQNRWPLQSECTDFYGPPGSPRATAGVCRLPFPFRIDWERTQTTSTFRCHDLVADAFTAVFHEVAGHYGADGMRDLGLDLFGGCYANRPMRGGSRPSMHAYGIAVDLDPDRNALRMNHTQAAFAASDYNPFWTIVESHGLVSLGRARDFDWMHFQAARLG